MVDLGSDPKLVNKSLIVKKGDDNKKNLYAALDLGTNSCRMLIARPTGSRFEIVDAFSKSIRLGIDLERTGQLSQAGIARALQALHVCAKKLNKFMYFRLEEKHKSLKGYSRISLTSKKNYLRCARGGPCWLGLTWLGLD